MPNYYNLYIIIFFIASFSFFSFVTSTFARQLFHVAIGYTIKQTRSIEDEILDINLHSKKLKVKPEYIRVKSFGEKIKNIIDFLKSDIGESLIVPERDLIY